jgi:HAD superfamily hydrolase (TIGR01549 family)
VSPARPHPALRAVFFDVDFTLIHPGPVFQGAGYASAAAARDVEGVDAARFDAAVAAASSILDEVEEPLYDDALFIHYTATILEHMGGRGPGLVAAARDIYRAWAINHHFDLYDDVAQVLPDLAARGLHIGVISNSHRSLASFVEHFALDRFVRTHVSAYPDRYMKPHRSIFDEALRLAGVAPAESLMVGDSLAADVRGALAAGLRAVLLRRSGAIPPGVPEGVPVIRTLGELPGLLDAAHA